jgi:hypothetical protein
MEEVRFEFEEKMADWQTNQTAMNADHQQDWADFGDEWAAINGDWALVDWSQ